MQPSLFPAIPPEVSERIDRALADPELTGCARAVLVVLASRPCAGRDMAISIADLQRVFRHRVSVNQTAAGREYSDREIKGSVKELVERYRVPVGSVRHGNAGYFLCLTPADREAAVRPIRAEVFSLLNRWRVLGDSSSIAAELAGQVPMEDAQ